MTQRASSAPASRPGRDVTRSQPDEHLRYRSGRHVWLDDTARARCCDPRWRTVLAEAGEWGTRPRLRDGR